MSYDAKQESVQKVQLKAQRLVLKFQIVGNATPASKTQSSDDPSVLFLRSEGIDGITEASGALDSGESVSYTDAAADATGIINVLVKIGEPLKKVLRASCSRQSTTLSEADDLFIVSLGDSDGLSPNGDKILLTIDSDSAYTSGTHNLCLELEYLVDESV